MDVGEDRDILLQKSEASHISELKTKLPRLVFHQPLSRDRDPVIRSRVRAATVTRLCGLLEPFQEWPQLLDQHLADLVRPLQDALLQNLQYQSTQARDSHSKGLVVPLDQAVCRVLYTLCKVRGPKVVSRFLENGAEYLEPAMHALEIRALHSSFSTWEEKYIYMLWIAHLLLTPFDLCTVGSSSAIDQDGLPDDLELHESLPPIATRLLHISMPHLTSASKERDAVVKLLSRLAARPDMIRLRLHDSLFGYALLKLQGLRRSYDESTPYDFIGCLSLLSGLLSNLSARDLKPYLLRIFEEMIAVVNEQNTRDSSASVTAVSRKLVIKNMRLLSMLALQLSEGPGSPQGLGVADYILEDTIDLLLNSLADKDTPVRQAASKGISAIAAKLQPKMAAEVVEAVIGGLDENVLWLDEQDPHLIKSQRKFDGNARSRSARRDLSAVNPLRWHGLVLTLAQLLFQRSAPPTQLSAIISSLVLALGFEQRSSSGSSQGSNVRDAANFGIWSIARKYSTEELLKVEGKKVKRLEADSQFASISIIQTLAAELIISATLDPVGNIRRGSSAALQELVGRHPDMVFEGITVVQVVDYHAVALRSKAFNEVAIRASSLHPFYWTTILSGMMGWRGLEATDASSRRLAAQTLGAMPQENDPTQAMRAAQLVHERLRKGDIRNVERRHGLLLAATALMSSCSSMPGGKGLQMITDFWALLEPQKTYVKDDLKLSTRRPELTAEAVSKLIGALAAVSVGTKIVKSLDTDLLHSCTGDLSIALERREQVVISAASQANRELYPLLDPRFQQQLTLQWIGIIDAQLNSNETGSQQGFLAALGAVFNQLDPSHKDVLQERILEAFARVLHTSSAEHVEFRVAALAALNQGFSESGVQVNAKISECLKRSLQDHTINERGDVGSLVRLEALAVTRNIFKTCVFDDPNARKDLFRLVGALAGEKLDKVRFTAWLCLEEHWQELGLNVPPQSTFKVMSQTSSTEFFSQLLDLLRINWLRSAILKGVCSSVGSGSESVLRAARSALTEYLVGCSEVEMLLFATTLFTLLQDALTPLRANGNFDASDHFTVPFLETWAFLFQSSLFDHISLDSEFSFRKLLGLVRKAHYKSGNVQKLTAAVNVYAGLACRTEVRSEALISLTRLLLHPQPKVRNAAADALYLPNPREDMLRINWSGRPADLKEFVTTLRESIEVN